MSCRHLEKLWRLHLCGDLSGRKRRRFEEHLAGCPECRARKRALEQSAALAVEHLAEPARLTAEEWQCIRPVWDEASWRRLRVGWALAASLAAAVLVAVLAVLHLVPKALDPHPGKENPVIFAATEGLAGKNRYEVRLSTSDPNIKIVWTFDRNFNL